MKTNTPSIADCALFSAEVVDPGIVMVRMKRHYIDNVSLLAEKQLMLQFLDHYMGDQEIKCIIVLGHPEKRGEAEFEDWLFKIQEMKDPQGLQKVVNAFQQYVRRLLMLPQIVLYGDAGTMTYNYLSIGLAANYFALGDTVLIQNPNAKYDVLPAGGATHLLKERLGSQQALELLASPEKLPAAQALEYGICDVVCSAGEIEQHLLAKARSIAQHRQGYLRALKSAMRPDLRKLDDWFLLELRSIANDSLWSELRN